MKLLLKATGGIIATGFVASFATMMIVLNKKTEVQVSEPNQENHIPENWIQGPHSNKLRIANWNLQNLNGKSYAKNDAAAAIIDDADISLLAVEEVDYTSALYNIAYKLNSIQGKKDAWKVVASDLSYSASGNPKIERMAGISAQEYYGFLYDSTYLTPKEDTTGSVGSLYNNPFEENRFLKDAKDNHNAQVIIDKKDSSKNIPITNTKSAYVRPPFGATFEYNENHKDFTVVMAHLDSPGAGANAGNAMIKNHSSGNVPTFEYKASSKNKDLLYREYGSIGSQEAWEAEKLPEVMSYFDSINGDDSDIFFMGDTNIVDTKKKDEPFKTILADGYYESFDPHNQDSKTTIGTSNNYVNPYDRIFAKTPLSSSKDSQKYDIGNIFSKGVVNGKSLNIRSAKPGLSDAKKISDHTMVIQSLDMTKKEDRKSSLPSHKQKPNIVDINNSDYFDLTTKLGLNSKAVYKILYYRKYVGKIDTEKELTSILKYKDPKTKVWKGNAHFVSLNNNVKFDYSKLPDQNATTAKILDQSSYITKNDTLIFSKIDINAAKYEALEEAQVRGLMDQNVFIKILTLRNKGTKINSTQDLGISNKNPSKPLFDKIFDFKSAPTSIKNPFDVNNASFADMSDKLVGYDTTFKLYPYDIAAIVAYRQQVGKIKNVQELQSIIGTFAANKISSLVTYDSPVSGVHEADLNNKIDIYNATGPQLDKYIGQYGQTIKQNILDEVNKNIPALASGNTNVQITLTKQILFKGITHPEYFENQFNIIFTVPKTGTVIIKVAGTKPKPPGQRNGYSMKQLIIESRNGEKKLKDLLSQFSDLIGKQTSKIGKMTETQFKYLWNALKTMDENSQPSFQDAIDIAQNMKTKKTEKPYSKTYVEYFKKIEDHLIP